MLLYKLRVYPVVVEKPGHSAGFMATRKASAMTSPVTASNRKKEVRKMERTIECRSGRKIKVEKSLVSGTLVATLLSNDDEIMSVTAFAVGPDESDSEAAYKHCEQALPTKLNLKDGPVSLAQMAGADLDDYLVTWKSSLLRYVGKVTRTCLRGKGLAIHFDTVEMYTTYGANEELKYLHDVVFVLTDGGEIKDGKLYVHHQSNLLVFHLNQNQEWKEDER